MSIDTNISKMKAIESKSILGIHTRLTDGTATDFLLELLNQKTIPKTPSGDILELEDLVPGLVATKPLLALQ